MSSQFWVIGGEYADSAFKQLVDGADEERFGPFKAYREAYDLWQSRAWATVDNCAKRFRIVEEHLADPPKRYWVLGGEYVDTGFRDLMPGTLEERLGPFDSYDTAHQAWQTRAWATVDNCNRRYRIVAEQGA